ncbi:MAG: NAD(P)-dependent dehydrogenase (short-subunit alcohol dehydrogenase family) [Candidatus Poriferisodalaceae bacterium]|jgi:NAD(P)-dependent dehydrogenase (short-subunit alcohol dehydrogenase family)
MPKTALVTGASTGIGQATGLRLTAAGWTVHAGVRAEADGQTLLELAHGIQGPGAAAPTGDLIPVLLDVTETASIERAIERVGTRTGKSGLDLLVNNAGVVVGGPLEHLATDEWRRAFDVNFFGVVEVTRLALPLMRLAASPRIVMVGSINSRVGVALLGPYVATKHALAGAVACLRRELAPDGPIVSLVEPGAVQTPLWGKAEAEIERVEAMLDEDGRRRYVRFIDAQKQALKDGHAQGVDADDVATLIEHIATCSRPRARYLVGRDAQAAGWAQRVLPDRAMEWLAARLTDRAVR